MPDACPPDAHQPGHCYLKGQILKNPSKNNTNYEKKGPNVCTSAWFDQSCLPSLTLLLLRTTYPVTANSVDPDQLASEEANWSGSALFAIKYVNL